MLYKWMMILEWDMTYEIYIGLYAYATMEEKTRDNSQMSFCAIGDNFIQLDERS